MPGGDGTGPAGMGPMTGRGAGYCTDPTRPFSGSRSGMGFGRGRGFGAGRFGRCRFFGRGFQTGPYYGQGGFSPVEPDPEVERRFLEETSRTLQAQLDQVKNRLKKIEPEQP